jgi:hypothetical protein
MDLTIEQVSKLTKIPIPTLRVYVSRQKLGRKVGNNRVFSQADVQKLLKGSRRGSAKTESSAPTRKAAKKSAPKAAKAAKSSKPKPAAAKPAAKTAPKPVAKPATKAAAKPQVPAKPEPKATRPGFFARLFGRQPKKKVDLLSARTTK